MSNEVMFFDCPAYMDDDGAVRCNLPAAVKRRYIMNSTDGPLESVMLRCPSGHFFNGPIKFLTFEKASHPPQTTPLSSDARLRDQQPGAPMQYPMAEDDEGRQPTFTIRLAPLAETIAEQLHRQF